ncbi:hypothetical protein [Chryseobacterium sp. OSA05B]|uniref:hypothetical protein n=1 Tax=Chryseobacterium sp. OSA05B TaxID=2862650 RepID=UPI001CBFD25C|nr:hypothetical protein [Chryseobacterium sp. OSA05B]
MKRLAIQSVPLTVIAMTLFTKWWFVLPVDAGNTAMSGFPFPFIADGWHTSLSYQIFITEFLADFFIQILLWTLILFLIHKYLFTVKIPKFLNITIWGLAIIISGLAVSIAYNAGPDHSVEKRLGNTSCPEFRISVHLGRTATAIEIILQL